MSNEEADKMFNEWFKETYRITFNSYQQTAREAFMAAWDFQQVKITRLEELLREARDMIQTEWNMTDDSPFIAKINKELK